MNDLKNYEVTILGYSFGVIEFPSGYISFRCPWGDNEKDKLMFDELVYHNQKVYNGLTKDKELIINNISNFIKKYDTKLKK